MNKAIIKSAFVLLGLGFMITGCDTVFHPAGGGDAEYVDTEDVFLSGAEDITGPEFNAGGTGTRAVTGSSYFAVSESGKRYRVDVNLRPGGYTWYGGAVVDVKSSADASGWRVNIGNSPTNNGYGGDAGTTSYDSELQLLNDTFSLYENDYGGSDCIRSISDWGNERRYKFRIANNSLGCYKYDASGTCRGAFGIMGSNIFNLNENAGYIFHVGINRTITSSRYGEGMYDLSITLMDPRTAVYLAVTSVANYPGAYILGHMGLVVGSDTNGFGWHFFSIERDNAPYVREDEIIWKVKLPAIAVGSISGGAEYSVLYHHQERTQSALFKYLSLNAPGVGNNTPGFITGQGYDRYARLKRYDYAQTAKFFAFVRSIPPSEYDIMSNNCASFSTYAIEDFYRVECNDNLWHVPNHLFDDLYESPDFIIERDDRIDQ
ncbi:MAG: hypothetical protein JW881_00215 [Spirochaetales bacterium]|nr:hypothetical protein [Spirochaetales bacterium]